MEIQGKRCSTSLASHNVISRPEHVNMNETSTFAYTIPFSLSAEIPAIFPDFMGITTCFSTLESY